MSYLKLKYNGLQYGIRSYGGLNNLRRITARNDDAFESFINLGNRTLPNQNPLVNFLLQFSVNVEWDEKYLISVIDNKINNAASACNFTSLYNRGKNFTEAVYPERNHNTLIAVPFHKPDSAQIDGYFNNELMSLVPFFPIYTTDTVQRFDIMALMDTKNYTCDKVTFSIVQLDVYALVIGFWRWLKLNRDVGASAHAYIAHFPLMNFYEYHNELVNYNYLHDNWNDFKIMQGTFNLEPFTTQLRDYTAHKNSVLMKEHMDSFTNFIQVNETVNINVDQMKMVLPQIGKSGSFIQMSWLWTLASLGWEDKYLFYTKFLGTLDGPNDSMMREFFNNPIQTIKGQIKDPAWEQHFVMLWNKVKSRL